MYGRPQGNVQLIFHIARSQLPIRKLKKEPACQTFIQLNSDHVLAMSTRCNFVVAFQVQYKVNAHRGQCSPLPSMRIALTWCLGLLLSTRCLDNVSSTLIPLFQPHASSIVVLQRRSTRTVVIECVNLSKYHNPKRSIQHHTSHAIYQASRPDR